MKRIIATLTLALTLVASAFAKDAKDAKYVNPAEFTKTAHIGATQTPRKVLERGTQFVIGNLLYDSRDVCKEAAVGSDYPAEVEGKKVRLLVGQKVCTYGIRGVTEVR